MTTPPQRGTPRRGRGHARVEHEGKRQADEECRGAPRPSAAGQAEETTDHASVKRPPRWRRMTPTGPRSQQIRRLWPSRPGRPRYDERPMTIRRPSAPRQRWQLLFSRTEPALRMRQAQLVTALERGFTDAEPAALLTSPAAPPADQARRQPADRTRAARRDRRGALRRARAVERIQPPPRCSPTASSCSTRARSGTASRRPRRSSGGRVRGRRPSTTRLTTDALRGAVVRLLAMPTLPGRRRGETERRAMPGRATCGRSSRTWRWSTWTSGAHRHAPHGAATRPSGAGRPEDVSGRSTSRCARRWRSGRASCSLTLRPSPDRLHVPRATTGRPASLCAAEPRPSAPAAIPFHSSNGATHVRCRQQRRKAVSR